MSVSFVHPLEVAAPENARALHALAQERADAGDEDGAWEVIGDLSAGAEDDPDAARWLAYAVGIDTLDRARRLDVARTLFERWGDEQRVLAVLGEQAGSLVDRRFLNAAPPTDPLFAGLVARLSRFLEACTDPADVVVVASGLASASLRLGRRADATCERAHRRLLELEPDDWGRHYDFGLFLKNRGRFAEGLSANEAAAARGGGEKENVRWNLGICATGAGQGEKALAMWRAIGCNLQLNGEGLPEGRFPAAQVRLAERPVAERRATEDEPGMEETIWIERLSPCHGRVRSALYSDLGVDYGDLVLFDGAPIAERVWRDERVPVFPHLSTLRREDWRRFPFAATQAHRGQVQDLGPLVGEDVELYAHTEQLRLLCATCWADENREHRHDKTEHHVIHGKLVIPPNASLSDVGRKLDELVAGTARVNVFVPELWEALGDSARAHVESRRAQMLGGGGG